MDSKNKEMLNFSVKRNSKYYYLITIVIAIFEAWLITFDLTHYDLRKTQYAILMFVNVLVISLSIWIWFLLRNTEKVKYTELKPSIRRAVSIYALILVLGAMYASFVDISLGATSELYIVALVGVSGILVINPKIYQLLVGFSFPIVLLVPYLLIEGYKLDVMHLIYEILIVIVTLIINYKNYDHNNLAYNSYLVGMVDPLTKAYNRRYLDERISSLETNFKMFYLGLIDFDNFKRLNDEFGHGFGDETLIKVVEMLKLAFGDDSIFRYGGDEFAVISTYSAKKNKTSIDSINDTLKEMYPEKGVSISAGFVMVEENPKKAFARADKVLYKAKESKCMCIVEK